MISRIDVRPVCGCSFFYLTLGPVRVCGIEPSHMGKNNGNTNLVGEKKISCLCSGPLTSTERRYQRFLINLNLYKLVNTKLRVSALNLMLDNTRTKSADTFHFVTLTGVRVNI